MAIGDATLPDFGGLYWGYIILGLYGDNGKENGNYYTGVT